MAYKLRYLLVLFVNLYVTGACAVEIKSLPPFLDGTMMTYKMPDKKDWLQAPDSLRPFHIEYVSRHGARYLSSEKKINPILSVLQYQEQKLNLSKTGKAFLKLLNHIWADSKGKWGALSPVGESELDSLGRQMAFQWNHLFRESDIRINAIASFVPRVVSSMYSFCNALASLYPDITIVASSGEEFSPLLRFFQTEPAYRNWLSGEYDFNASWEQPVRNISRLCIPSLPAEKLFKRIPPDSELQKALGSNDKRTLSEIFDGLSSMQYLSLEMYGVLQSLRASGQGIPTTEWMSADEYEGCWKATNAEQYYKRSFNSVSTIPMRAVVPLLIDIITNADAAVGALQLSQGKKDKEMNTIPIPAANLMFGHAETILPLAALMRIPGACYISSDNEDISSEWQNYNVAPLAANIELVLAEASSGDIYAALALNGLPVIFPEQTQIWIKWNELRRFWLLSAASF